MHVVEAGNRRYSDRKDKVFVELVPGSIRALSFAGSGHIFELKPGATERHGSGARNP